MIADHNRAIYDRMARLTHERNGWANPGEEVALVSIAPEVRNKRLLDIGVGTGRTTGILRLLSEDYVGIDYSPVMVEVCQRNNPRADIRVGDARTLTGFDDATFDLVVWSYNGIDSLDHDDRALALRSMRRVLRPEGLVLFSTLNRHGRTYGETPWQLHRPGLPTAVGLKPFLRAVERHVRDPNRFPRRLRNWLTNRRRCVDHGGWALNPLSNFDFRLISHFVSLEHLRTSVREASFDLIAIYDSDSNTGDPIPPAATESTADSFYVVARKVEP
jgi:SAM-dependent methyltransferase